MLYLLKLLLTHDIYLKYNEIIYTLIKDNIELSKLYRYIQKLQTTYNKDISIEELSFYILTNCTEKDKEFYSILLQKLMEEDSSNIIFEETFRDITRKHYAYELAVLAFEVSEGKKDYESLQSYINTLDVHLTTSSSNDLSFVESDLELLKNESFNTRGLRWRLGCLNRSLGSLRKGDFGFIFARPETGKTTFLASEISYFATQTDRPILWFNNEEQGSKVQLRIHQAFAGKTLLELFNNTTKYRDIYEQNGGRNIRVYDSALITKSQVESICKEFNPGCIVFDQLDKIQGFSADREDLRLGHTYIWARELAKVYCPVIGVCQSDASGEGRRWLEMDNVANAKTAKQAEADWIVGIGKTHAESEETFRYLSICKNKLIGDDDSDPAMRHAKLQVKLQPEIARYLD